MRVLAIETSCDETGVAVVEAEQVSNGVLRFETLGAALLSQAEKHAEFGGVYPTLAKREHIQNLPILLKQALDAVEQRNISFSDIDAVAVTSGPGLEPALWAGIEFAKDLAEKADKPLFPVNHMEGHVISSLVKDSQLDNTSFPILALLISGGHTELVLMREWFQYEKIGETLDDAAGEALDKIARMLGLPYPGGPHISRLAAIAGEAKKRGPFTLPRPMLKSNNCDFSFSGLKTAALYAIRDRGGVESMNERNIADFALELENAVVDVLVNKTRRALTQSNAKTFVIGGGVAASTRIRKELSALVNTEFVKTEMRLPELSITGDNAIMIAQAALARLTFNNWKLSAPPTPESIRARGRLSL